MSAHKTITYARRAIMLAMIGLGLTFYVTGLSAPAWPLEALGFLMMFGALYSYLRGWW